jgi:hypothetical protein
MPRKPRFTLPGIPQHVIQRGNNREPCFLAEHDYRRYLDDLQNYGREVSLPHPRLCVDDQPRTFTRQAGFVYLDLSGTGFQVKIPPVTGNPAIGRGIPGRVIKPAPHCFPDDFGQEPDPGSNTLASFPATRVI